MSARACPHAGGSCTLHLWGPLLLRDPPPNRPGPSYHRIPLGGYSRKSWVVLRLCTDTDRWDLLIRLTLHPNAGLVFVNTALQFVVGKLLHSDCLELAHKVLLGRLLVRIVTCPGALDMIRYDKKMTMMKLVTSAAHLQSPIQVTLAKTVSSPYRLTAVLFSHVNQHFMPASIILVQ